jgi:hypothetical protein
MVEVTYPAFYTNKMKHLVLLATEGHAGFLLSGNTTPSTSIFSEPLRRAYYNLLQRWAVPAHEDPSDASAAPSMLLPALEIFRQHDQGNSLRGLGKVIQRASNQAAVCKWYCQQSPDYIHLERIKKGNPDYGQRITHLSTCECKAPHKGYDLHPPLVIKHSPTAFLCSQLPYNHCLGT